MKKVWLALLLLCGTAFSASTRLDLPTLMNTVGSIKSRPVTEEVRSRYPDALLNSLLLIDPSTKPKPTVYDLQNSYARWGNLDGYYTEVAIWRTTNGKALVGVNYVGPRPSTCGDYPCVSVMEVFGHNSTRFVDASDDAHAMAQACSAEVRDVLLLTDYGNAADFLPPNVLKSAQANYRRYAEASWLIDSKSARTQCFLPRKGTSVMVGIATDSIVFAQKQRPMPLFYVKFDPVRGTFTPSVNP